MSTNYPTSIDNATTMPVVVDNVTIVTAAHHNNQSDALQAVETKLGTGASTATDGKFLVGNTTAGSSQWRTIAATDVPDISATYAPAAKGVTNGDSHDHSGGDGGQIAYASLSGTPTIPVKATGTEIDAGTNDAKFATPKAIEDSSIAFTTDKLSNFASTSSAELAGVISDETGSGKLVFDTSPTLVTPTLGVASATSVNKVAITAPTTSATITVADGKTFTNSNTLTLTATDGSTLAIGTGGTLGTAAYTASTAYATSAQGTTADNAVPKSLFDANSIIYAKTDDTPLALVVGASTIVGRKSTGDIVALTATETRTILNVADGATANTKATGAEVDTGTDDAKFVTSKAMEDSDYIKSTGNAATATNIANNTGTTTTVLHGNAAGAPSFGAIVEADLSLSDNSTGNVSTSKHGFTPKLSNNAGQFLDGTGNWSAPSGSGDVLGPATNTADYLPQWNGANSKTLKDGVAIPTGGLAGLTSPVFTTPQINDTSSDHQYITAVSELTADRTVTLPLLTADDEFMFKTHHADLYGSNSMARQAIINGNFDVWQRGTTVTNGAVGTYLADRWQITITNNGTLPTNIVSSRQLQTSGDLPGSYYHYRIAPDGAGSGFGVNDAYGIQQTCEYATRYLAGNGKKVTVSFYARSSIANKKLGVYLLQSYGTGGSPTAGEVINGESWTLTSSWVKYTYTFTTNTLASKTFGTTNDDYLRLSFWTMWGSTIGSRVNSAGVGETFVGSGNIDIAQVQLCAGDVALPFMPKSFEEELRACMRYCEKVNVPIHYGWIGAGGFFTITVDYSVPKRANITSTISDESLSGLVYNSETVGPSGYSRIYSGSGGTAQNVNGSFILIASAEL
jgi:hypothetical protein